MHTPPKVTIHLQLQDTYASGSRETGKPGELPPPDGLIRIPFKLKVKFNKHVSVMWKQQRIDEAYESGTNAAGAVVPGPSYDDVANTWSASYAPVKSTVFSLGYYERVTSCCPWGMNDEHLPFVAIDQSFGKKTGSQPLAKVHVALLHSWNHQAALQGDEGSKFLYRAYGDVHVPVEKKLFAVARAGVFSDYFNGQPFPFYYDYVNWGLSAAISPRLTYSMMIDTLTQDIQGQPFAAPSALHRSKFVVTADYKI